MKFTARRYATSAGLLVIMGTIVWATSSQQSRVAGVFGGAEEEQIVRQATTVRLHRIVPKYSPYPRKGHPTSLYDYKTKGDPVTLTAEQRQTLTKTLLEEDSYLWDVSVGCEPVYGVRAEFVAQNKSLDVYFCFQCGTLAVPHDGKRASGGIFSPSRAQLVRLIKPLFPDDEAIQNLKEKR